MIIKTLFNLLRYKSTKIKSSIKKIKSLNRSNIIFAIRKNIIIITISKKISKSTINYIDFAFRKWKWY